MACPPCSSLLSYLFSRNYLRCRHHPHVPGVAWAQLCSPARVMVYPAGTICQWFPWPPARQPLCPLQALLGVTSLGTAPQPCQHPASHVHVHLGHFHIGSTCGLERGQWQGVPGHCKANGASWDNCPHSPLQLRAPTCSAPLAPLSHLYTRGDTCTNTSQIIKVYLGQCLWLRSFCQWHIAHHSAWGTLGV